MARTKGSKNKTKAATSDGEPRPNGDTPAELSDDQKQVLALQWKKKLEAAEAAKDEAVSEIRNIRKKIKLDLGADGVETVKAMMSLETEAGEAKLQAMIEHAVRAARWMGVPLGMQPDLFGDERAPATDKAFAAGKAARLKGEPMKPPHDPSVPQFDAWLEGFHAGTAALNAAQRRDDAVLFDSGEIADAVEGGFRDAIADGQQEIGDDDSLAELVEAAEAE